MGFFEDLHEAASPETRRLVTVLLEQDAVDRQWAAQVGPSLTQADAARLLGKTEQVTAKDARLLRARTRTRWSAPCRPYGMHGADH